jgi:uncharacterized protein YdbL (DUF1318 family)
MLVPRPCFYVLALWLTGCVVVNITFPAAATEKAADQIIDKIQGKPLPSTSPAKPVDTPELPNKTSTPLLEQHGNSFNLFIPVAWANQANLDISSPAIQTVVARQAERYKKLEPFYNNGTIGLTNDGLIALRDPSQVPLKSRNEVNSMITAENQDRLALYREIAIANKNPDWENDIRLTFARRWIERALPGWWYQDSRKNWQRK